MASQGAFRTDVGMVFAKMSHTETFLADVDTLDDTNTKERSTRLLKTR
jgi:hypothetical protein